ncbi:MAG: hypothetical protein NT069_00510 [Planctomycetota bacterium]|nr:hypothetical protein [Planctomycetota bacterium]
MSSGPEPADHRPAPPGENPWGARFRAPEFPLENAPSFSSDLTSAFEELPQSDTPGPPPYRLSLLGVFATTVLSLLAANVVFGVAYAAAMVFSNTGEVHDDSANRPFVARTVAAIAAVGTFAGLFCLFVIPKWRASSRYAFRSRDGHEREKWE